VLSTLTYKNLFSALQFGYGSALSTLMFVTEIIIAVGFGVFLLKRFREVKL
jgi:ABC-type sugar transport system permease subunit